VWRDNGDGSQNTGEPGLAGQPVRIYLANATGLPQGAALAEVTTNASTACTQFSSFVHSLQPNTRYVIEMSVPSGLQPTLPLTGGTGEDSNGVPVAGAPSLVHALVTSPTV
jgi:hypothetical protein